MAEFMVQILVDDLFFVVTSLGSPPRPPVGAQYTFDYVLVFLTSLLVHRCLFHVLFLGDSLEMVFFIKSHQPSGLRWFRALYWCHPSSSFPLSLGRGLPLPLPPPQDSRSGRSRVGGDFYSDFFCHLVSVVFRIVFRCLFGSILAPVCLPTCPQNRPKSKKNRCQDAIHLGLRFLIDF